MRYLLLVPVLAAVFAAGYLLRPQPAPPPAEPKPLPAEPALIIPSDIPEPTTPPPGKDLAFEVIRAHFAEVAHPAEPAPMPRELGEPDPLAGPIAVTPPGRFAVPPRPPEPEPYPVVFSRTEVVSIPFGVTRRGPSGIREAQVWITRDDGDTWELLAKQGGETSPITARLPGEGLFGFRLVLVGGDGASSGPPKPRDPPELRVAFEKRDSTVPLGNLLGVEPAGEEGPMPRTAP